MPRYMTRQGDSMRLTPFAPGLFNEKPLNLENTTSSVLSVLLSIYDNIVVLYSFQKVPFQILHDFPYVECRMNLAILGKGGHVSEKQAFTASTDYL